jgi:hypothetical protein
MTGQLKEKNREDLRMQITPSMPGLDFVGRVNNVLNRA